MRQNVVGLESMTQGAIAMENQLEAQRTVGEIIRTQSTISGSNPTASSSSTVSQVATVTKIISDLAIRYQPSAQADMAAHAAKVSMLIKDVSHVPPHLLQAAADDWAKRSAFLPKASEIIEVARTKRDVSRFKSDSLAARYNAQRQRDDVIWEDIPGGGVRIRHNG